LLSPFSRGSYSRADSQKRADGSGLHLVWYGKGL
jgi:hypothetical protein